MLSKKLDNNLRIVLSPSQSTQTATVLVLVGVGSRYEANRLSGLAHFTEHMMFKGTSRRSNTLHISRELDAVGAEYNAFTSKEYTGYYIKVNSKHLTLALDILSDMLINSKLDATEIEREKGVIVEEINMYEDTPMMMIEDVFEESIYRGHPLARGVAGRRETVTNFERDDFVSFKNRYYRLGNMIVSVAGNIDPVITEKMIVKYFKFQDKSGAVNYRKFSSPRRANILIRRKQTQQAHLALGLRTDIKHKDSALLPLKLANVVFGGNMSSRLFINIRERQGLCYYIRSKASSFRDTGDLAVYAGLDVNRIEQAIKLIRREFVSLGEKGITLSELNKAKEYIKGKIVITMENSSNVAQWYAERWLLTGGLETPSDFLDRIENVKLSAVNKILARIINPRFFNLALIGDFDGSDRFSKIFKL